MGDGGGRGWVMGGGRGWVMGGGRGWVMMELGDG